MLQRLIPTERCALANVIFHSFLVMTGYIFLLFKTEVFLATAPSF